MLVSATVKIKGIKPILINTFPISSLDSSRSKSGSAGKNEEEWKNSVLMDEKRRIYVMNSYLLASITAGGKQIKVGKSTLSKKIGSTLEISEDRIFLEDRKVPEEKDLTRLTTEPVYLDVRSVVNPMTKGRNLRHRIACSAGWRLSFTILWNDMAASKDNMKQCLEFAGMFEGIGDGRKIGFGRFQVESFSMND